MQMPFIFLLALRLLCIGAKLANSLDTLTDFERFIKNGQREAKQKAWEWQGSEALGLVAGAMNILENKTYPHHPVMNEVSSRMHLLEKGYILDLNGLKVPAYFDCDIFNNDRHNKSWGKHKYFYEVPSRWYACWKHHAAIKSGVTLEVADLPLIDDEYSEHVAIYQSVLRAKISAGPYVFADLGARWGTWGARAIAFLRSRRPDLEYKVYFAESHIPNCKGLVKVMVKNSIDFELDCKAASPESFLQWSDTVPHIDVVDLDIQGYELDFISEMLPVLQMKAYRLIIGTHDELRKGTHAQLRQLLADWIVIWDVQHQHNLACVYRYIRGYYNPSNPLRFNWRALLEEGCWHQTPRGKVAHYDGELILDNPRFVNRAAVFSLDDNELRVDDFLEP